jgi:replicative DNA helicase|tara:strand:+ start:6933 stop:8291 length:1359 start_codon:yes stop_codon:yes gene_type:complete
MMTEKELPHNEEAERGLVASVFIDWDKCLYKEYVCDVKREHFYNKEIGTVFHYMQQFVNDVPQGYDPITFKNWLENNNLLVKVGGIDSLLKLQDSNVLPYHTQHYARIITNDYNLRKEIKQIENCLGKAYIGESVADELVGLLTEQPISEKHKSAEDIEKEWDQAREGKRVCIPTPYPSMDRQTGGIRQGMVTIFTGRSKSGKSMFLAHWYNYLARKDIPILAVPLEDKYDITIKRMSANHGGFNVSELDSGGHYYLHNAKWEWTPTPEHRLEQAKKSLQEVCKQKVYFYDRKCTPQKLKGIAKRYKAKHDIQAMFVDGAKDLLRPSGKYNDVGFDEEISQYLCSIAEELNIAVISIHHLTKISDDERINVNHIRGSGNIVGDARAVYALQSSGIKEKLYECNHNPNYCSETGKLTSRIFECLVNNHGSTAMKILDTNLSRCQFTVAKQEID